MESVHEDDVAGAEGAWDAKQGGCDCNRDAGVGEEGAECGEEAHGGVKYCRGRLAEEGEAGATVHVVPAVPKVDEFANGIKQTNVLGEKEHLVDALEVAQPMEPKSAVAFATKDDAAAGFGAEAHLRKERIDGILFDCMELGVVESPAGQRVAHAREPDMGVAHEGFVAV